MSATGAVDLSVREPTQAAPDISVVMPCLNEAGSVGTCVEKAWEGIRRTGLTGEVVFSDNGSTDDALDTHFSLLFALLAILGYQTLHFGVFARTCLPREEGKAADRLQRWFERNYSLERGLIGGGTMFMIGFVIDVAVLVHWLREGLGPINSLRPALLAMTLMMVGAQTGFAAFFLGLFRIDRPR